MSARARPPAVLILLVLLLAAACTPGDPDLRVGEARAATPSGGSSQVLVDVVNEGDGADTLVGVDSEAAAAVELHRTEIEEGRASMVELDEVEIAAGETLQFRPGSLHLMLVAPDETVVEGGTFEVVLRFDRTGDVPLDVEVVPLADVVDDALPE